MTTAPNETNAGRFIICLSFAINQRVNIRATGKTATVYSICIGMDGIEYRVKWWNDDVLNEAWLRPSDLEAA